MGEGVRFDHLQEWEKELNKCSTCGYCTYWCPIYQEDPREESVTRGKIAILKNLMTGKIKFTEETAEILERCLMCGTCLEHCVQRRWKHLPSFFRVEGNSCHFSVAQFQREVYASMADG